MRPLDLQETGAGLNATLRNQLSEIRELADAIEVLAERLNLPGAVVHKITLAADELITNIISYGLPQTEGRQIFVEVHVGDDSLSVEIVDDGPPFDPFTEIGEPDTGAALEDRPVGGLGIHFVRKMLDKAEYERMDNRNRIRLIQSLRP